MLECASEGPSGLYFHFIEPPCKLPNVGVPAAANASVLGYPPSLLRIAALRGTARRPIFNQALHRQAFGGSFHLKRSFCGWTLPNFNHI